MNFVEKEIPYHYGNGQKKKRVKKLKFLYDLSDSRASDNNKMIFILDEDHKSDLDSSPPVNSKTKDFDPKYINFINCTMKDIQKMGSTKQKHSLKPLMRPIC